MLKVSQRQIWTCPSCSLRVQRRNASALAHEATKAASLSPASHSPSGETKDDHTLRRVFDSKPLWNEFSQRSKYSAEGSAGLVRNRYLATPQGFMVYAQHAMRKCSMLVRKTLAMESVEEYRTIVKDLDRLSDLLCRVIDLSDFIRSAHPDRSYQHAATLAYSAMFEYMNQLNTTTGLNEQLKKAASIPEVYSSWTEEERTVANILIKDFNKSAIDLSDTERQKFVTLSNEIAIAGTEFTDTMAPQDFHVRFRAAKLKGMSPVTIKHISKFGMAMVPSTGPVAATALSHVEDPDVRREIYMANRTASESTIRKLEQMLTHRSQLARLAGYESYAHLALADKLAKTPDAVNEFLQALKADTQPVIQSEIQQLLELKTSDAFNDNFPSRINAWDKDHYIHRLLSSLYTRIRSPDTLASYFSLGSVFQGLSRLFNTVYGIRLCPEETLPGETWHDEVRRLDVVDDLGNVVAVVYCDLFARPGKSHNPAHFTLRCSRSISAEEVNEFTLEDHPFSNAVAAATEGMAYSVDKETSTVHQLPTIALICDFSNPRNSSGLSETPTLLSLRDVQTLFHEMGHALHSILGRTSLQNVSGTRCATDLAELPSVLMEYFAFAPRVLGLWARHWETDRPLPYALVEERLRVERHMQGIETEGQIMMALLDQSLHARNWHEDSSLNSTAVYHQVYSTSSLPDPKKTAWQGFFGHLYGYGATYYSYLFARAIAGRIWKQVFANGDRATDRASGEKFKQELLQWGGGRDGWKCIAGVLNDERLAAGDQEAMRRVGKWGVRGEIDF
jgi:intermediate peptidase